jgi:hypothetical protein
MNTRLALPLVCSLAWIAACGDAAAPRVGTTGRAEDASAVVTQWVVSKLVVPASASQAVKIYGCDFGSGKPANKIGSRLSIETALGFDVRAGVDDAFNAGEAITLLELTTRADGTAALRSLLGTHEASDGLTAPQFYAGGGHFKAQDAGASVGGTISDTGMAAFTEGSFEVQFPLFGAAAAPTSVVQLGVALVRATLTDAGIDNAHVCGAVPAADLIRMAADFFSAQAKQNPAGTLVKLVDADHSCAHDAACTPHAAGACHCVTEQEIVQNKVLASALAPDVDVTKADSPFDRHDKKESLSFGFGLRAREAEFTSR